MYRGIFKCKISAMKTADKLAKTADGNFLVLKVQGEIRV